MMKKILVITLFLILGCARIVPPTKELLESADYGRYPRNYKECSKSYLSWALIDPISGVYSDWEGPEKGWAMEINKKEGYVFGYIVCVNINVKNKMSGYVGERKYCVFINNENIKRYQGNYPKGNLAGDWATTNCS